MPRELSRLHEAEIRQPLLHALRRRFAHDPTTLVLDEFGILEGRSRIDVAVVNGALHGYEIKSDRDSLRRLAQQAESYAQVFDFLTIVAAPRHLQQATRILPPWWGVMSATPALRGISLQRVRRAHRNTATIPIAQAQLLWRNETATILANIGADRGVVSKPRLFLWQRLVETLPRKTLALHVREALKMRQWSAIP